MDDKSSRQHCAGASDANDVEWEDVDQPSTDTHSPAADTIEAAAEAAVNPAGAAAEAAVDLSQQDAARC